MIDWNRVKAYLSLHTDLIDPSLKELLVYLYEFRKLSWREIAKITDGYVHYLTLIRKAKELGIKSRSKGGSNNLKSFELTQEEMDRYTLRELEQIKGVSHCTVWNKARRSKFKMRKKGKRPRVPSVQVSTFGNGQESH